MNATAEKTDQQVETAMSAAELDALLAMEETDTPETPVVVETVSEDTPEVEVTASPKNVGKKKEKAAKRPSLSGLSNADAVRTVVGSDLSSFLAFRTSDAKLSASELDTVIQKRLDEIDSVKHVKMSKKVINVFDWMKNGKSLTKFVDMAIEAMIAKGEMTTKELKQVYLDRPYQDKTASSVSSQMARVLTLFGIADRDSDGKLVLSDESTIAALYKSRN